MIKKKLYSSAFTIIELIVIIVIIGILSSISLISYNGIQARARDNSVLSDIESMDAAQTKYSLDHNTSGLEYYSVNGESAALDFKASEGNVIDVATNSTDYCIRGYNPNSSKKSIDDAFVKESSTGACSIPPSAASRGIEVIDIGNQTWMKHNLNVGTMIPETNGYTDEGAGAQVPQKHCKDDDENNCIIYGALYNWGEAMNYPTYQYPEYTNKQGICYDGFHIPTSAEFDTLATTLGGSSVAGGKMKEVGTTYWTSPNVGATNESNFTARGGGYAYYELNYEFGTSSYYWTSTQAPPIVEAYYAYMYNHSTGLGSYYGEKSTSMSIRCIKD